MIDILLIRQQIRVHSRITLCLQFRRYSKIINKHIFYFDVIHVTRYFDRYIIYFFLFLPFILLVNNNVELIKVDFLKLNTYT